MDEPFLTVLQVGLAKVLLCSQHGSCYTRPNLERHLAEQHGIKRARGTQLIAALHVNGLATNRNAVQQLANGVLPFKGLPLLQAHRCCDSLRIGSVESRRNSNSLGEGRSAHPGFPHHDSPTMIRGTIG